MSDTGASNQLAPLRLKRGEERRIESGHLWIFSNEVDTAATPLSAFAPGAQARVLSARDKFLGYAYVNPHALICARILGRDPRHPPSRSLLVHRMQVALALRERLYPQPFHRLVHGESDGLPGLVIDRYGDVLVAQAGTAGIEATRDDVAAAAAKVLSPASISARASLRRAVSISSERLGSAIPLGWLCTSTTAAELCLIADFTTSRA